MNPSMKLLVKSYRSEKQRILAWLGIVSMLIGYGVNVNNDNVNNDIATIDLRIAPDSKR
jgi:hypothetical protein